MHVDAAHDLSRWCASEDSEDLATWCWWCSSDSAISEFQDVPSSTPDWVCRIETKIDMGSMRAKIRNAFQPAPKNLDSGGNPLIDWQSWLVRGWHQFFLLSNQVYNNMWKKRKKNPSVQVPTPNHTIIELDDGKVYRKALYLMVKTMVSCRFSLKPIQWYYPAGRSVRYSSHRPELVRRCENWPELAPRTSTDERNGRIFFVMFISLNYIHYHSLVYDKIYDLSIIYHDD